MDVQLFKPADSICPYEGLPHSTANPALVSLEKLRARLAQSVNGGNDAAKSQSVSLSVKFLKRPQGYEGPQNLSCELDLSAFTSTVAALKEWMYSRTHLPVKSQKLVYKGKAMSDTAMLKEYIGDDPSPVIHCMSTGAVEAPAAVQAEQTPSPKAPLSESFWTGLGRYVVDNSGWSKGDSEAFVKRFKQTYADGEI